MGEKQLTFQVAGEDPITAVAPLYANFVGIAHVGHQVQLEFIFLDINQLALRFGEPGERSSAEVPEGERVLTGKTVAKVVVPASSFIQLKEHLAEVFRKLEVQNEQDSKRQITQQEGAPQETANKERSHGR